MKVLFVDGYNVINSWPNLKEDKKVNLEAARQKLIDLMQDYAAYKSYKIFIVFDGHRVRGNVENKEKLGNVIIVFTKEDETADSYIERSVNNMGKRIDITVVTSDSMEQMLIFQRGAARMSSMEFYFEVDEARKSIQKKTEKKFVDDRNPLEDRIQKNVLEKLEKIRRSR